MTTSGSGCSGSSSSPSLSGAGFASGMSRGTNMGSERDQVRPVQANTKIRRRIAAAGRACLEATADAAAKISLPPLRLSTICRIWMIVLSGYLRSQPACPASHRSACDDGSESGSATEHARQRGAVWAFSAAESNFAAVPAPAEQDFTYRSSNPPIGNAITGSAA